MYVHVHTFVPPQLEKKANKTVVPSGDRSLWWWSRAYLDVYFFLQENLF